LRKRAGSEGEREIAVDVCVSVAAVVAKAPDLPLWGAEEEEDSIEGIPGKIPDLLMRLSQFPNCDVGRFCTSADGHTQQTQTHNPQGFFFPL
jgi:hypothetical protein